MAIQTDATLMNMTIQNYTTTSGSGTARYNAAGINIGGVRGASTGSYLSMVTIQGVKFYNNSGNSDRKLWWGYFNCSKLCRPTYH